MLKVNDLVIVRIPENRYLGPSERHLIERYPDGKTARVLKLVPGYDFNTKELVDHVVVLDDDRGWLHQEVNFQVVPE